MFFVNAFEDSINNSIFSGNEQQKMSMATLACVAIVPFGVGWHSHLARWRQTDTIDKMITLHRATGKKKITPAVSRDKTVN